MKDINDIMPKIPGMRWGAVLNHIPSSQRIREMDKLFPSNGKWHTVFEEKDQVFVDNRRIWKKDPKAWTR